jgi:predicted TIM-barrel fold metal-dependent hydrolase
MLTLCGARPLRAVTSNTVWTRNPIYDMRDNLLAAACDCHVHVVGSIERFPQIASRSYTAGPAMMESLRAVSRPLNVTRFVVVQPSFYGTDNSCLFEALDELGDFGRGVAVVDAASTSSTVLGSYRRRGICGLRLNLYSSNVAGAPRQLQRSLAEILDVLPRPGWHVEIIARVGTLAAAATVIADAGVPVVIDHYGLPENESPAGPVGRALLDLAALPHVWIKLSAPYRCNPDALATCPPSGWLTALVQAASDRCVWGSDWPHTPPRSHGEAENSMLPYRKIAYDRLLNDFLEGLASPEMAHRILIENPIRLYGFPHAQSVRPA